MLVVKLLLLKSFLPGVEFLPGIEGQEPQLPDQLRRAIPHAAKQVHQIAVVIVVHLKGIRFVLPQQHCAGTTEGLNVPLMPEGEQGVENGQETCLISYPCNGRLNSISPSFLAVPK